MIKKQISNFKFQISNDFGFTIMEMVVVVFIISIGLIGVLSLVVQNVQVEYVNKNMIIASQLAQEGLELVRNVRDNNWVDSSDWVGGGAGTNIDIVQDNNYAISMDTNSGGIEIFDVSGTDSTGIDDNQAKLYLDGGGFYKHYSLPGTASSTIFSRIVTVDEIAGDNSYITLSCIVQWRIKTNTHQYVAQTRLYDWR